MKTIAKIVSIVVVIALLGGGLGLYSYEHGISTSEPSSPEITVTDSLGRTFTFNHTVTRIVSIDPAATATLYALGAYKYLVGGNAYDCYPPNESLPNTGNAVGINYEEIVNLSPQVVLYYGDAMNKYTDYVNNTLHIPVLINNPENFQEIENFTHMLGVLTGTEKNASLITAWMNQSLNEIENATSNITNRLSAFYYLCYFGGYYTVGNDTFIGKIMYYAHLRNIATNPCYYDMPAEDIVNDSPQVIILDQYVNYSAVEQEPFNSTPAFQDGMIFHVPNDNFMDEPDFRTIFALEWLINEVYPFTLISLPKFPISLQYPPTYGFT